MSAVARPHPARPTTLQVALNGGVGDDRMPRTPPETARQAAASVAEGATSIHLHAYDDGVETLEAGFVATTLNAVRELCPGVPVNMTTFADVEPDPRRRHALLSGWTVLPDLVPANQGEDGIGELAAMLAARGVGVEACLLSATRSCSWPEGAGTATNGSSSSRRRSTPARPSRTRRARPGP